MTGMKKGSGKRLERLRLEDQFKDAGKSEKTYGKNKDNHPKQNFHDVSSLMKRRIPEYHALSIEEKLNDTLNIIF